MDDTHILYSIAEHDIAEDTRERYDVRHAEWFEGLRGVNAYRAELKRKTARSGRESERRRRKLSRVKTPRTEQTWSKEMCSEDDRVVLGTENTRKNLQGVREGNVGRAE